MPDDVLTRFAAYPSAVVYERPHTTSSRNAVQHCLWGDWIGLRPGTDGDWREVYARGVRGWMHQDDITAERLLEVNFVDIGQGDGCLVVTPDDEWIVIDAGEGDNMYRFLRWRYRLEETVKFHAFVITHPDQDHYYGFRDLLAHPKVEVGTIYHNGLIERSGDNPLGPTRIENGREYIQMVRSQAALARVLSTEQRKKSRKRYTTLLRSAVQSGRVDDIRMLSARDRHMPGFGPSQAVSFEVLGPVPEKLSNRRYHLRSLGDTGKTKNGHSIVMRLNYGDVRIFLGGDLNIPAEDYLLRHYTGLDPDDPAGAHREQLLARARVHFESDIAKACHHGSPDFRELFLEALNPVATVVSSGDDESYAHPRPDALGSFGRYGRGRRPLIFSTELARSSREVIKEPNRLRHEIRDLERKMNAASSASARARHRKKRDALLNDKLQRSVAVYGMITLRTDGHKVVMAQKLEAPRSRKSKWDIHKLVPGADGRLVYESKH